MDGIIALNPRFLPEINVLKYAGEISWRCGEICEICRIWERSNEGSSASYGDKRSDPRRGALGEGRGEAPLQLDVLREQVLLGEQLERRHFRAGPACTYGKIKDTVFIFLL